LGIILGHVARSQIKRTGEGGRGLATAALIIGWVFTLIALAIVAVAIMLLVSTHNSCGCVNPYYTPTPETSIIEKSPGQ
jgi:hypothetical protein